MYESPSEVSVWVPGVSQNDAAAWNEFAVLDEAFEYEALVLPVSALIPATAVMAAAIQHRRWFTAPSRSLPLERPETTRVRSRRMLPRGELP